jgi:hypothetical protein
MKEGKAEVLNATLEGNGDLRVKLAGRIDRDSFITLTRSLCGPGTIFEILSDTEVLCKSPKRAEDAAMT